MKLRDIVVQSECHGKYRREAYVPGVTLRVPGGVNVKRDMKIFIFSASRRGLILLPGRKKVSTNSTRRLAYFI